VRISFPARRWCGRWPGLPDEGKRDDCRAPGHAQPDSSKALPNRKTRDIEQITSPNRKIAYSLVQRGLLPFQEGSHGRLTRRTIPAPAVTIGIWHPPRRLRARFRRGWHDGGRSAFPEQCSIGRTARVSARTHRPFSVITIRIVTHCAAVYHVGPSRGAAMVTLGSRTVKLDQGHPMRLRAASVYDFRCTTTAVA